jgi:hypothetical protein
MLLLNVINVIVNGIYIYIYIRVVIVLAIAPKFRGLKPGRGRWICKCDKISSMTSFGEETEPSGLCRKMLRHVKDPSRV